MTIKKEFWNILSLSFTIVVYHYTIVAEGIVGALAESVDHIAETTFSPVGE